MIPLGNACDLVKVTRSSGPTYIRQLPMQTQPWDKTPLQFSPVSREACSTSSSSSGQARPVEFRKRVPTILCVGDSLTSGSRDATSYPQELQAMLDDEGIDIKVSNGGNWGDTTDQVLRRLPSLVQSVLSRGGRLSFVLVLAGTNDLLQLPRQAVSASIPGIMARVREICEFASQAAFHPHVGILLLPPLLSRDADRVKLNQGLQSLHQVHLPSEPSKAAAAPGAGLRGLRFLVDLSTVDAALSTDGVHYGQEGYKQFAKRVMQVILPMLKADSAAHQRLVTSVMSG